MSIDACNCDTGLFNLHSADCVVTPGITRKLIFVKARKADGTPNGIDLSQPFGETEIDALIAQSDKNLRWFISDKLKNFTSERADPTFETVDNENLFVSQGTRAFGGNFYGSSAALAKKLNGNRCTDMAVFSLDGENGLTGVVERDLWLDPIELNKESFWSKVVFATEGNRFNVQFAGEWDRLVADGDLRTLTFADHGTNILKKVGLIDVFARFGTAPLATELTIDMYTVDGNASGDSYVGLLLADFTVTNTTTALAVVPSAVVEGPNGTYTITIAAQTAGDKITVTALKAGFDFSATVNEVITAI